MNCPIELLAWIMPSTVEESRVKWENTGRQFSSSFSWSPKPQRWIISAREENCFKLFTHSWSKNVNKFCLHCDTWTERSLCVCVRAKDFKWLFLLFCYFNTFLCRLYSTFWLLHCTSTSMLKWPRLPEDKIKMDAEWKHSCRTFSSSSPRKSIQSWDAISPIVSRQAICTRQT